MVNNQQLLCRLAAATFTVVSFLSCSNSVQIPFPENELGYSAPVVVPLKFSAEKKLNWDTTSHAAVKPVIKTLDLDALPSTAYDTVGYKALTGTPQETRFDFNQLPGADFNFDSLISKPLHLKTYLLPLPVVVKAQAPAIQKTNPLSLFELGTPQGLPAKFIVALLKDKNGLLWISSGEGLFRYDGEHVQTIVPGPIVSPADGMAEDNDGNIWFMSLERIGVINLSKGTISYTSAFKTPDRNISRIIKDKDGRIWVSNTTAGVVVIIEPATQTFKTLDKSKGLSDGQPADIVEDNDKNIWIISQTSGANIINPEKNKIKYLKKINGLGNDSLRAITKDKTGKIWIARHGGGVDAVDVNRGTIKRYDVSMGFKQAFTTNMSSDNKGRIWMGKDQGAEVLDPQNNRIRLIDQSKGLGNDFVLSCTMDDHNRMWVATIGGLSMIEQNAETVHPFNVNVTSLIEDGAGNLWVATQKGLFIINFQKKLIRRLDAAHGLSNDFVQGFTNTNGKIIVATNGGYNIIDPIGKTIETATKKEGLLSDAIYVTFKDKAGNMWMVGPNNGVDVIDSVNKIIRHVDVAGGLSDNNIQDFKQDNNGLMWLATNKSGVDIIDPVARTVKYLNDQPGLRDTCNRILLKDKQGRMWIGTDKGVYVADLKHGTLTTITTKEGLTDNRVLSLLEYNGSIAAGTNRKITLITPPGDKEKEWKIAPLDKSETLIKKQNSWASDYISSKGQYLWGDADLTIINDLKPATDSAVTYVTSINVITKPQYFINEPELKGNDTLWTADTFYISGKKPLNKGYAIDNKLTWKRVSGPYNMPVNLQLPHDQNYIQFHFAQAYLGRQDNTLYTYVLEGIDKYWSIPNTNPYTENYLNLPPGQYTFKVCSKGLNGKWGLPALFSFSISPPWYHTWWAYTLYALLGIGLLRAYVVYRSRQLQRENKILEEKVNLRTKQLQQSIEDLKTTQVQLIQSEKMASLGELTAGIAHEIQNPLNFVNNFSEVSVELADELKSELNKSAISPEEKKELELLINDLVQNQQKINFHGKRADGIVKGMLQHSRSTNGIKEPTDINALADEYFRLSYHGLRAKDKSFNATMQSDFEPGLEKIKIVAQDVGRVILNLITNAFYSVTEKKKMNIDGYEPTVRVSTKKIGDTIEIKVKDNGPGVPQKVLDKIFQPFFTTKPVGQGTGLGLSLSYDIIKAHGGELKVETKEGEGATFIITLPVKM